MALEAAVQDSNHCFSVISMELIGWCVTFVSAYVVGFFVAVFVNT